MIETKTEMLKKKFWKLLFKLTYFSFIGSSCEKESKVELFESVAMESRIMNIRFGVVGVDGSTAIFQITYLSVE